MRNCAAIAATRARTRKVFSVQKGSGAPRSFAPWATARALASRARALLHGRPRAQIEQRLAQPLLAAGALRLDQVREHRLHRHWHADRRRVRRGATASRCHLLAPLTDSERAELRVAARLA
eukprot:3184095-Pleurochrysis_carterae.AAC.1